MTTNPNDNDYAVHWQYRLEITKVISDTMLKIVTAVGATAGPIVMVWMQMNSNAKIDTATQKIDTVATKADRNAVIAIEAVDKAADKAAEKAAGKAAEKVAEEIKGGST
jgi:uncharacterized membrane protein YciS (DUF1049 family)